MPLTAISDFERLSKQESPLKKMYAGLASIVKNNNALWCTEAEKYLMKNAPQITL